MLVQVPPGSSPDFFEPHRDCREGCERVRMHSLSFFATEGLHKEGEIGVAKMKTHRGAAKRFKVTGTGKVMRNSGWKRHLLEKKSSKRKRRLTGSEVVAPADQKRVLRMLPNR